MPDLSSILPLIFDGLPAELLADPDRALLQKIASRLPLVSGGILEVPISADGGPVGLGLRLVQKEGGFAHLENAGRSFKPTAGARPVWKTLQNFAAAHKQSGSILRRAVAETWLEFDLDAKTKTLPAPSFFFKLEDPYSHPATAGILRETGQYGSLDLIQKGLESLDAPVSAASLETLRRCIQARNASTGIAYIGVMTGRKAPGFRLVLGGMPFSSLTAYLRKIEYPQGFHGLLPLIDIVSKRMSVERLALQLDIVDGVVQPRLGIEIAMDTDANPAGAWESFLKMMTFSALCTPARARAVPAWHRHFHRAQMRERWPEALSTKFTSLYCTVSHVKFSYQPGPISGDIPPGDSEGPLGTQARGGELSAKAYLAYQYATGLPGPELWPAARS